MPFRNHYSRRSNAYPRDKPSARRALRFITVAAVLIFIIVLLTSSPVSPAVTQFSHSRPSAHQPPVQPNSTSGDAKWYSDWKWHNPFSFSITLDETRSVLPPLRKRPPIYTFYDSFGQEDGPARAAEIKLLQIWRKAWWAKGFRPVVLGRAEAMMNPLYESVQRKPMDVSLQAEFMRWLAWSQMGSGILADWLVLPMGSYDDYLLSFLRRGDYPKLTRYEGLGNGFFAANAASINEAIKGALNSNLIKESKSFIELLEAKSFTVDAKPAALAFYNSTALSELYGPIVSPISDGQPTGLTSLARLITSHLHQAFLDPFSTGIMVLVPYEERASFLTKSATHIAKSLAACPSSPIPSSCPPNNPKCSPCSASSPVKINTSEWFVNTSTFFTIGTISHPYTLTSLLARRKEITVRHIRRDTERDPWLSTITQLTLGKKLGGPSRIVPFKETVASEWGAARGFWLTEDWAPSQRDLEWHFGFELAAYNSTVPDMIPLAATGGRDHTGEKAVRRQEELIDAARVIVKNGGRGRAKGIRDAVEAWNLADTEAWRFVRAFRAREVVERKKWEEEERRFAGGSEDENGGHGWRRWFDRI